MLAKDKIQRPGQRKLYAFGLKRDKQKKDPNTKMPKAKQTLDQNITLIAGRDNTYAKAIQQTKNKGIATAFFIVEIVFEYSIPPTIIKRATKGFTALFTAGNKSFGYFVVIGGIFSSNIKILNRSLNTNVKKAKDAKINLFFSNLSFLPKKNKALPINKEPKSSGI